MMLLELMKICLRNPDESKIFFYPTFCALEFLFSNHFLFGPNPGP